MNRKGRGARAVVARLAVLAALLIVPIEASAAMKFLAPLTDKGDGSVECTDCCTAGAALTTDSLVVGAANNRTMKTLANHGSSDERYLTSSSDVNPPAWRVPLLIDLGAASTTAANLSSVMQDASETGTANKLVWDTGPTISAPVFTGAASFSGITGSVSWAGTTAPMTFPANTFDDFTDFKADIKTGGSNGTKFVTAGNVTPGANNCAKWNANGTLEDHGSACGGGTGIVPRIDVSPLTQVTVSTTPLYCGLDGSCSATANGADVQTPLLDTGSFTKLECQATAATGQAITVKLGLAATCGGALNVTTKAQTVMSATQWTAGTPTGTTSWTNGQCVAFELTTASGTSNKVTIRCSMSQSAGT